MLEPALAPIDQLPSAAGVELTSVEWTQTDVLLHLDAMTHISPWEQRITSKLFFDRDPMDPALAAELLAYFDQEFPPYQRLAVRYLWGDLLGQRKCEPVAWLEEPIRLWAPKHSPVRKRDSPLRICAKLSPPGYSERTARPRSPWPARLTPRSVFWRDSCGHRAGEHHRDKG